ncbi:ninein-like [Sarcophilus harrisii]|uniref:ninein-like n=1 Tax=Sarcophilus harrisii TaxID=9305 RepID=UPI000C7C2C5F|nr:ninein-like [Sarcophilus harrisii]
MDEKQQLQKHLEKLKNMSESQQKLSNQIFEFKNDHQKNLKVSQVDDAGKLEREKLEEWEIKCEYENEDMASQFLIVEDFKKTCKEAVRKKVELSLEISRLLNKMKELQYGMLSKPQSGCQVEANENANMASDMSLLQQSTQLLEENGDIVINLQWAHERAVKDNVKMAAEIIRLY